MVEEDKKNIGEKGVLKKTPSLEENNKHLLEVVKRRVEYTRMLNQKKTYDEGAEK